MHPSDAPAIRRQKKPLGLSPARTVLAWVRVPASAVGRTVILLSRSSVYPTRHLRFDRRCATAFGARAALEAVAARLLASPAPSVPEGAREIDARRRQGERSASHKVPAPSALAGGVAFVPGRPASGTIPLRHSAAEPNGLSTIDRRSIVLAVFRRARALSASRCTPAGFGPLCLPQRVMHRRVPLLRDVPLPAAGDFSRTWPGRVHPDGALGVLPFAVLTRPVRVGAFPPVLPTCRFLAGPLRRYRSKDRPP